MSPSNPDLDRPNAGSAIDGTGNASPKQEVAEDARAVRREAGVEAREKTEAGQHRLAGEADALSDAIDAAASRLDDQDREGLARYARELSGNLANAAEQLEGRSVDELANDAKRLARDNPALYMLGSIAVGFGLSRFFKASAQRDHHDDTPDGAEQSGAVPGQHGDANADPTDAYGSGNTFPDDGATGEMPVHRRERDMTEMNTTSTAPRSDAGREMP